ncbi:TonB-dependent receptor domain-containing protein [Lysobacter terrae]
MTRHPHHHPLAQALKLALTSTLFGSALPAFAQDAAQPQDKEATTLERIEVTGSRIKRTDIETSQPVFSLSRDEIQAQGLTSVGDVIQNITANGSTLNTTMNNGGNGETQVSLRNLGSNRTLVLVNGRRWIGGTGLGGAVDLNTIPTAAVERIEVLKDGASTIYGSDAIAGVVNVILRQNFDGAEANAYIGQFDEGDGTRQAYDFTIGSAGDRWTAMFGVGYVKEEPVMAGDREISERSVFGAPGNAFFQGSSTVPNGRFALCAAPNTFANGRCVTPLGAPATETRPNGTGGQFTYNDGNSGTAWRNRVGTDVFNFAPDNYLLTPQERKSLFMNGSLDITDNVRFKATATYNQRTSEQLLAAIPIVLGSGPGASPNGKSISISPFSMYNPFGQTVSRIQRRAVEAGRRSFVQNVDTFAFNGGFEGTLEFGDKAFDWEAGYFWGENRSHVTEGGQFNLVALRDGLGPSMIDNRPGTATSGKPVCVRTPGDLSTIIGGCVPINLLGSGTLTPEMLGYAAGTLHSELEYKQKTYYANIGGDLFDIGDAGAFAFSFGLEHRSESGFDSPDALIAAGNSTGNNRKPTSGGYSVDEAYLELAIPVLKDLPGARLLDFSAATRWSDYSTFGDTLNSKFGFRWKPIDDLMVRGNWSEGFRAPSVAELFTGISDSFPTLTDPCNLGSFPSLSATQQARCVAQGVPAGGYDQGNPQIRISAGGNPNLQPETTETTTLGFVYSPSWLQGFDVSLDWWKIDLDNAISLPTGQFIVDECIRGNVQFYCDFYTRAPGGALDLTAQPGNVGGQKVEGFDLTVSYRLPETSFGKFSFTWDTTYLSKFDLDLDGDGKFGESITTVPSIGQSTDTWEIDEIANTPGHYQQNSNAWRIRSNLATRWEMGDFGATWNVRYYGAQEEDCQKFVDYGYSYLCSDPDRFIAVPEDTNGNGVWDGTSGGDSLVAVSDARNHIPATTYHDVSAYWNAPWNAKITLGVNNVFDKDPPVSHSAFANSFDPQYELPGRFYYMRYTQKF